MALGSSRRHSPVALVLLAALSAGLAGSARGAPGDLDTSLGGDGTVVTSDGLGWGYCGGFDHLAVSPDGKMVVTGYYAAPPGPDCNETLIARLDVDGGTDTTFDDGSGPPGTLVIGDVPVWAVAVQTDGKVVIAGDRPYGDPGGVSQVVVRRYLTNGYLDVEFGIEGEVTFDTLSAGTNLADVATALAIQPFDGKLVIGGSSGHLASGGGYDWTRWFVARLTTAGELDPAFGGGAGYVTGPNPGQWRTNAIAVADDGPILAHLTDLQASGTGLIRLTSAGTLDTTFGVGGVAAMPATFYVRALTLSPLDARIALAGNQSLCTGTDQDLAVYVLTASGTTDTTFGGTGHACILDGRAYGAFYQDDGRLVVGGSVPVPAGPGWSFPKPAFVRYLANGAEDPAFGASGRTLVEFGDDISTSFQAIARWGEKVVGLAPLSPERGLARVQLAEVAIDPPVALRAGGAIHLTGGGITPGTRLKAFLATASGAVDVVADGIAPTSTDAVDWLGALPYPWPLSAPLDTSLGNGFVALQLVRTDQGYSSSSMVGALLLGNAALGIPSVESLGGTPISPTSADLSIATANVEVTVPRNAELVIRGEGFANPVVNVFTATGNIGPLTPSHVTQSSIFVLIPSSAPIGPGSFQVVNKTNWHVSNAVSAPLGERITVSAIQYLGGEDSTFAVTGTGFNELTVINLFGHARNRIVNVGGLYPNGKPKIPIDVTDSHHFTFSRPSGLDPGAAFVEALNPPFIPFSSSGSGSGGSFQLP